MTLEELLAKAGLTSASQLDDPTFQVIPHSGGNTVIADNRFAIDRPGYMPNSSPLAQQGQLANQLAAKQGQDTYARNYTQSLATPFTKQGPFPDYDTLKKDPKWNELYVTNSPVADRIFSANHGKSFTDAMKEEADQKDFFKKTLQEKFAKRQLFQGQDGSFQEVTQEPDELGQLKSKIGPISFETASMLAKIGGPEGLGLGNMKQALMMKEIAARDKQPSPTTQPLQDLQYNKSDEPIGIPGALANLSQGVQSATYRTLLPEINAGGPELNKSEAVKNLLTSILGSKATGRKLSDPIGMIPNTQTERQILNILRSQKGLGPISDAIWQEYLSNRQSGTSNKQTFNSQ